MTEPVGLSHEELRKEAAKKKGEELCLGLVDTLLRLRLQLEQEEQAKARQTAAAAAADLAALGALVEVAPPALPADPTPAALQDYRRAALRAFEAMQNALAKREARLWQTRADAQRRMETRRRAIRFAACFLAAAALLGAWLAWQQSRIAQLEARLNQAKTQTAREAVKSISLAAWQATQTTGKPLGELVPDMTADCQGVDVNKTLPNHPCREAWAEARHVLFRASIPEPGRPQDAPSELFFDPWGGPYLILIPPGGKARIVSAGPAGRLGDAGNTSAPVPYWDNEPAPGRHDGGDG